MIAKFGNRTISQFRGLPHLYWYLWVGTVIMRAGTFVVPFLTLYLTGQRDLKVEQAATIISAVGMGSLGSGLFGGALTDSMGRRFTLLMSLLITPPVLLTLGNVHSYAEIFVAALAFGFFSELYRPASAAMVADLVEPQDRVRAYALLYWGINLGAAIAPLLAGYFATRNYMLLFIADAMTTFMFGLVIWWRVPDTKPRITTANTNPSNWHFSQVARDGVLWGFVFLTFLFACLHVQSYVTLPLEMKAEGLSEGQYGTTIAMNGFLVVLLVLPLNTILSTLPRFQVLSAAAVFSGVGFGMHMLVHSQIGFVMAVLVWTSGEILAAPIASAVAADLAPLHLRGVYQGFFRVSWGMASFIGPTGGGYIYSHFGGDTLWSLTFIVGMGAAVGYLLLSKPISEEIQIRQISLPSESI